MITRAMGELGSMADASDKVKMYVVKIEDDFHEETQSFQAAKDLTKSLCATGQKASMVSTMVAKEELKAWLAGKRKTVRPTPPQERKRG